MKYPNTITKTLRRLLEKDFMRNATTWLKGVVIALTLIYPTLLAHAEPELYFVHSDHLNTPQMLTDQNGQVVWQVESQTPFGIVETNDDVDGDGQAILFNLRFPGQYYDSETGLSYNYFRDYDPLLGRYIQSDPIGLEGGINTYGYALQNPEIFSDPYGQNVIAAVANPITAGLLITGACVATNCGQKAVDFIKDAFTPPPNDTGLEGDEERKQGEYDWYKTQCETPPVKTGDYCQDLKNEITRAQLCAELRSQWDSRWDPGSHDAEIEKEQRRAARLLREYEMNCKEQCD